MQNCPAFWHFKKIGSKILLAATGPENDRQDVVRSSEMAGWHFKELRGT
jgi:hypothetical protein